MANINNQDNVFISVKDLWNIVLHNWYWFVVSVVVALSIAITYIVITPPIYTRTASIMIKSDGSSGQGSKMGADPLIELGLINPNTDIKSEIYVLKSPSLMESVVRRLKLDYNYSIKYKSVRNVDLYNDTPVLVELDSALTDKAINFSIELLPSNQVKLSNFVLNGTPSEATITGSILDTLQTPYGKVILKPTVIYTQSSDGRTINFSKLNPTSVANAYSNALAITYNDKDAPILWLSLVDGNTQRAEDILNTLISVYNENWIKDRNRITGSTSSFIGERLAIIENELGGVDQDISSYKSENLLPNVEAVGGIYLAQSTENANKHMELQNQLSMARYIRTYMNDATSKNQLIPANTGIESANIEGQIERYNTLLLQKNNLLSNSSEQNPVIADMIKNLSAMKELILRSIDDYISVLTIRIDNIVREEKSTNKKLASNPSQAKHLLSIERQQKVKEALYLFLLQKREENALTQTFSAYNTKVINAPSGSMAPTAPRKNSILLAALVVGLLLPALILIVIESLDTLVRSRNDLDGLSVPFVGEIPMMKRIKRRFWQRKANKETETERVKIVVAAQNRDIINEAFRNVRNNIDFMRPQTDGGSVIMTTSLFTGSGKTFISSNIALSMALKGAKTIIIDVDLRKATISKLVNSPKRGLSDYLAGKVGAIEQVIVKSEQNPNFDVLPAGKIPPNPSELILNDRFGALIEDLRSKYDYIFLDCPPVEIVSETAIIGGVCDMTLFIVRIGIFDKRMLPAVEDIYKRGQFKNMGLILNDVDYSASRYGYGKYGYGKYGYGEYGYGTDSDDVAESINKSIN